MHTLRGILRNPADLSMLPDVLLGQIYQTSTRSNALKINVFVMFRAQRTRKVTSLPEMSRATDNAAQSNENRGNAKRKGQKGDCDNTAPQ